MERSLALVLCLTLLLGAPISAQSYSVRVTYNTNLRASYRLEASIVGGASEAVTANVIANVG